MDLLHEVLLPDLSKYCRTCFTECDDEGYDVRDLPKQLYRLFIQCIPYERFQKTNINLLCPLCYDTLRNFEEFRSKAVARTYLFERFIKSRLAASISEKENIRRDSLQFELNEEFVSNSSNDCYDFESQGKSRFPTETHNFKFDEDLEFQRYEQNDCVETSTNHPSIPTEDYGMEEGMNEPDDIEFSIKSDTENKEYGNKSTEIKKTKGQSTRGTKRKISFPAKPETKEHNSEKQSLYSCSHCERTFQYSMTLNKHLTEIHNLKPTYTVCPDKACSMAFQHDEAASQHYRYHHQMGIQNDTSYICELCGEMFETEQKLKNHYYKHEPDARPFHCELCNKRFVLRSTYKEHQLRHAGIKAYECPQCNVRKTSARELRAHMNVHNKEKQYPCSLCSRIFRWPQALRLHSQITHKGIRKFICQYCDQAFGKLENLKHHERRHTGEKPFECIPCGYKFISYAALQNHCKTKSHMKKSENLDLNQLIESGDIFLSCD